MLLLLVPKLHYAQLNGIGVQVDIGTSSNNFSALNNFLSSSGLQRLDEFSYNRGIGLILPLEPISVKAGYNLSEYFPVATSSDFELRYTNWQLYGGLVRNITNTKSFNASFGLGVCFSNSSINYYRSSGINPFTNDSSRYFYMSRNNNIGFRAEANVLFNVFKSDNSKHQVMVGLNSAYCFIPSYNDWINVSGHKIRTVPDLNDNMFYLNVSILYRYKTEQFH